MNFKTVLIYFSAVALIGHISCAEEKKSEARIEPVTTMAVVSALAPIAQQLFSGLLGQLLKPNDYADQVIFGRSMRVKMCGDACVQITDRSSGISCVGTGKSVQEALGDASKKIFDELLTKNLLSLHDLCNLHITFPHPNQATCPGVLINPCNLAIHVIADIHPCTDKFGLSYCTTYANNCKDHFLNHFMMDNCHYTCTHGVCGEEEKGPCDL